MSRRASLIGATRPRTEDDRLLAGRGRYVGDMRLPRVVDVAFVRSNTAHGQAGNYDPAARTLLHLGDLAPATHYVLAQRARRLLARAVRVVFVSYGLDALLSPALPALSVPCGLSSAAWRARTSASTAGASSNQTC